MYGGYWFLEFSSVRSTATSERPPPSRGRRSRTCATALPWTARCVPARSCRSGTCVAPGRRTNWTAAAVVACWSIWPSASLPCGASGSGRLVGLTLTCALTGTTGATVRVLRGGVGLVLGLDIARRGLDRWVGQLWLYVLTHQNLLTVVRGRE